MFVWLIRCDKDAMVVDDEMDSGMRNRKKREERRGERSEEEIDER